jgi:hypothetical protein
MVRCMSEYNLRATAVVIFKIRLMEYLCVVYVLNFDFTLIVNFFNLLTIQSFNFLESILTCLVCLCDFMGLTSTISIDLAHH